VIVLGANDLVNPRAKAIPPSPLYGMPWLDVDRPARCSWSSAALVSGYAPGIRNDLFELPPDLNACSGCQRSWRA